MAISEMAISFLSAAKVQQKMHIRKQSEHFFWKIIDLSIEYAIHIHDRSLLMRVKSEWHIHKAKPYFSKKMRVSGVWAAFCGCTFEEGPAFLREVHSKYNKKCKWFVNGWFIRFSHISPLLLRIIFGYPSLLHHTLYTKKIAISLHILNKITTFARKIILR